MKKFVHLLGFILFLFPRDSEANALTKDQVTTWVVDQISRWSPPGRTFFPDAKETKEEALKRYKEIANDLITVVFDPNEPSIFGGSIGRHRTLALMMGVLKAESSFRKDIDLGLGALGKGDGGQSWCLVQIKLGKEVNGKTPSRINLDNKSFAITKNAKDYGGEDLVKDRKICLRAGLRMVRSAWNSCGKNKMEERLSVYVSGNCQGGKDSSRNRVRPAFQWISAYPPPGNDDEVKALWFPTATISSLGPKALH